MTGDVDAEGWWLITCSETNAGDPQRKAVMAAVAKKLTKGLLVTDGDDPVSFRWLLACKAVAVVLDVVDDMVLKALTWVEDAKAKTATAEANFMMLMAGKGYENRSKKECNRWATKIRLRSSQYLARLRNALMLLQNRIDCSNTHL